MNDGPEGAPSPAPPGPSPRELNTADPDHHDRAVRAASNFLNASALFTEQTGMDADKAGEILLGVIVNRWLRHVGRPEAIRIASASRGGDGWVLDVPEAGGDAVLSAEPNLVEIKTTKSKTGSFPFEHKFLPVQGQALAGGAVASYADGHPAADAHFRRHRYVILGVIRAGRAQEIWILRGPGPMQWLEEQLYADTQRPAKPGDQGDKGGYQWLRGDMPRIFLVSKQASAGTRSVPAVGTRDAARVAHDDPTALAADNWIVNLDRQAIEQLLDAVAR